jgi:hypothetical protein
MKAFAALSVAFLCLAAPAHARMVCSPGAELVKYLREHYGEELRDYAETNSGGMVILFLSPKNKTWTLAFQPPGKSDLCMLGAGKRWQRDLRPVGKGT